MRSTSWTSELLVAGVLVLAGCPAKHAPVKPDDTEAAARFEGDGFSMPVPAGWELTHHKSDPNRQALIHMSDGKPDAGIEVTLMDPPFPTEAVTQADCDQMIDTATAQWGNGGTAPATAALIDGPGGPQCALDVDGSDTHTHAVVVFGHGGGWLVQCTTNIGDTTTGGACDEALAGWQFTNQ